MDIGRIASRLVAQHLENVKTLDPLTDRELTRAIRDAIIAEEGAINQYETVADSTDNEKVKEVLQDIANEEKVHVGELQALLNMLLGDEEGFLDDGEGEVEDATGGAREAREMIGKAAKLIGRPNKKETDALMSLPPKMQKRAEKLMDASELNHAKLRPTEYMTRGAARSQIEDLRREAEQLAKEYVRKWGKDDSQKILEPVGFNMFRDPVVGDALKDAYSQFVWYR